MPPRREIQLRWKRLNGCRVCLSVAECETHCVSHPASSAAAADTNVRRQFAPAPEMRRTSAPSKTICDRLLNTLRTDRVWQPDRRALYLNVRQNPLAVRSL